MVRAALSFVCVIAFASFVVGCGSTEDGGDDKKGDSSTASSTSTGDKSTAGESGKANASDIVETAVAAGDFKTLVAAVKAADLVETLKGEGPFTVFAPTDEAFAALPAGTLDDLLKPENKEKLVSILTYHVVPGKVMASESRK